MTLAPSPARIALERYLTREAGWRRQSSAPDTNFFVPQGAMFAVPESAVENMFRLQSQCWRENTPHCLMEKQLGPTCLVVDVDADYTGTGQPGGATQFTEREFARLSVAVAHALQEVFDWEAHGAAAAAAAPEWMAPRSADPALGPPNAALEYGVHVAYFVRPHTKRTTAAGAQWREGLHVMIYVRAPQPARRYLFERLSAGKFVSAFATLGTSRLVNAQTAMDSGPITAPIALLGSPTKPHGTVYRLAALHRLRFGHLLRPESEPLAPLLDCLQDPPVRCEFLPPGPPPPGLAWEAFLTIMSCAPAELDNPAWELSVGYQARNGAIQKWEPPLRPAARAASERAPAPVEDALAEVTFMSPAVSYWRNMLRLVPAEQLSRNEWRDIIYAIASLGPEPQWRLLAEEFSNRARHRDGRSRAPDLPEVWPKEGGTSGITWRSILFHAKQNDPDAYQEVRQGSALERLRGRLRSNGGELTHHVAAEILYHLFRDRFVVVEAEYAPQNTRGRPGWFELGHSAREIRLTRPGDEWKWNWVGVRPSALVREITDTLLPLVQQVLAQTLEQVEREGAEASKPFIKELKMSCRRLQSDTFMRGALQRAADLFADYRFAGSLDRDPRYFGIAGGVLEVCDASDRPAHADWVRVHTSLCAAPVSHYTTVRYVAPMAHPDHPARHRLRQVLHDIFDTRLDWIMKYSSLALRGGRKTAAFMVMLIGGGNNGKSVFLELMRLTFGHFGYKAPVSILTSAREKGQDANSAYASMKGKRFIYFSEPEGDGHDQRNALRMARVKEMLSPEAQSTRALHAGQENFILEAIMFASTNNDFTVQENNYSVWKRLVRVVCETRFVTNPHPDDPREKLEDPSVSDSYINDPETQSAFLAELISHYTELQERYGGNLKRVPNAKVRADTQFFRESQDLIHQFIRAHVYRRAKPIIGADAPAHEVAEAAGEAAPETDPRAAPDYDRDPLAIEVVQAYNQWRTRRGAGRVPNPTGLRELRDSVLGRYHYAGTDRREYFRDVRILDDGASPADGEEPLVVELDVPVPA